MKNIFFKLIVMVLALAFGKHVQNPCKRDTNKHSGFEFLGDKEIDESFYQLSSIIDSSNDYLLGRSKVKSYDLHGDRRCPYNENGTRRDLRGELHHLPFYLTASTCPSHMVINYDVNRVPAVLAETQCTCKFCGLTQGRCRPIYYFRRVLRRTCDPKRRKYTYSRTMEPLQIGCTCIDNRRKQALEQQYREETS